MANAAGLQLREGDPIARLADALSHSQLLLVLDNCEHLVSDVAKVAQAIVERAPGVTVLATSQIALHIPTENVYRLGTLDLPAADTTDVDRVVRCFTESAVVVDEQPEHRGHLAIARWKADATAKYHYSSVPIAVDLAGPTAIVTARVAGDFPGSPVELRYRFALEGDRIARLEIAP